MSNLNNKLSGWGQHFLFFFFTNVKLYFLTLYLLLKCSDITCLQTVNNVATKLFDKRGIWQCEQKFSKCLKFFNKELIELEIQLEIWLESRQKVPFAAADTVVTGHHRVAGSRESLHHLTSQEEKLVPKGSVHILLPVLFIPVHYMNPSCRGQQTLM